METIAIVLAAFGVAVLMWVTQPWKEEFKHIK